MDLRKKIALIAAGSLVSAGALFAVLTSANAADTSTTPAVTSPVAGADMAEANDVPDATDVAGANEANDPADANEGPEVAGK
jgi:hypothetical protein